ncbi:MAG TPA: DUF2690 domain-containing protein [Streptosporangiaceae bacterium]|nr:DUF2690 domain-containing protein [Streptosporangiaceae bacterium]
MPQHWIRAIVPALAAVVACALWTPAAQAATTSHLAAAGPRPTASLSAGALSAAAHHSPPRDNWWYCGPGQGGYQCDNTDPYATNCASSRIYVASGDANLYRGSVVVSVWQVQLWYSTSCGTIWSRLQLLRGPNACGSCVLEVVRHNYDSSVYDTSDEGSSGGTLYSGAWTNQLYLPCGYYQSLVGDAVLWHFYQGTLGYSNDWYPGC